MFSFIILIGLVSIMSPPKGGCLWVRLAMSTIFLCSGERSVLDVVAFFDIVLGFKTSSCP